MPADEIIKGLDDFTEQPRRRTKDQGGQWRTIREFKGPQRLAANKEDELLLLNPTSIETELGVPATIRIETDDGGGTTAADSQSERDNISINETIWELDWNRLETDLRDNSLMQYILSSGNLYTDTIDVALAKGTASATNYDAIYGGSGYNAYRDCKLLGVNSFVQFQPVLKATVTGSYMTAITLPAVQAGKIIAWADIELPVGSGKKPPATIAQPKIHVQTTPANWQDVEINQWMIMPCRKSFVWSTKQWQLSFEWHGAVSYIGALYDGGTGKPTS